MSNLPQVVHEDPNQVLSELIAQYQAATGKTLYPAQIERLMINLIAYRETVLRSAINDAARQSLPQFARLAFLIYLGALLGVERLAAQAARTTLRFSLTLPVSGPTIIAAGTRLQAETGALFATQYEVVIPPGQLSVDALAVADTTGPALNGLLQNAIKEPFDELPTGVTATNITMTNGGSDQEDVERFRTRVLLAFSRPSAGSRNAYKLIALTADVRVIDVSVSVVAPGWVRLAVLAAGDPAEVVARVDRAAQADDVRPVTDRVDTVAAAVVPVTLSIALTPQRGALTSVLLPTANTELQKYAAELARKLGADAVDSQAGARLQVLTGVKRVVVSGFTPIAPGQVAELAWNLTLNEAEDE